MGYRDNSMVPARHIGHHRPAATGIGVYRDPLAALTGTFLTTPTEQEALDGTQTIIITLTNGVWLAAGADFNASRQAIIDGLDSAQSEATGWNTLIRDALAVTAVVRTSATVVTITMANAPLYHITANETITWTVPPTAILDRGGNAIGDVTVVPVDAAPTVTCAITGTFQAGGVLESEIVTGGETIILTLTDGVWVAAGAAAFDTLRQAIIDGMTAAESEAAGWNVEVRDKEVVGAVARTSNTVVTITLTAAGAYSITADENITITVPLLAVELVNAAIVCTPVPVITEGS